MQLAINYEFAPVRVEPRFPLSTQTQLWQILNALRRGERLTVSVALQHYQCFALSQRCGDLKVLGWPVKSRMVKVASGKRIAEYWL